jgi:hypothetical protein
VSSQLLVADGFAFRDQNVDDGIEAALSASHHVAR